MSTAVSTIERVKLSMPSNYKVVLLNNEVTPFDFVITLLMEVFGKGYDDAASTARSIHDTGYGVAGTYEREVAEQKQYESVEYAREFGHPELEVVLEKE